MNCRTDSSHGRCQLTWSPSGELLSTTFPQGLVDPNCQGSVVASPSNGGDVTLYLSNDNTSSGRENMTIKSSADAGGSWAEEVLVWDGPSAYSQLVSFVNGTGGRELGLLFELGVVSPYEAIGFAKWGGG